MATSLKTANLAWIYGALALDALALLAFTYPATLENTAASSVAAVVRLIGAAIIPVVILLLTSLLPSQAKASLVFWRPSHSLPGHRAFSLYAGGDPRIDLESLRQNIGSFPDAPSEQNALWYRLYRAVETEIPVNLAHQHFLLFRDLAVLSLLLIPLASVALLILRASGSAIWFAICLFALQYLATAIAARNHGVRLVTNVLAFHSSKN